MTLEELGSLLIRLSVAWLFLTGFWFDVRGFKSTEKETGLVFKWHTDLFATAGMVMMGAGGVSILFGIFPRLGALALVIFLIPASIIHFRSRDAASELKQKILDREAGDGPSKDDIEALGTLGFVGHFSSGLKNLALIGPTLYLVLAGGKFPMLIGLSADGTLRGLLFGN
ncbi:MAG: DoxX family membrane protein [Pseudomonadota bacterium]